MIIGGIRVDKRTKEWKWLRYAMSQFCEFCNQNIRIDWPALEPYGSEFIYQGRRIWCCSLCFRSKERELERLTPDKEKK